MAKRRPLLEAIQSEDLARLHQILAAGPRDLNHSSAEHDGRTPLSIAVHQGRHLVARLLLEAGADPQRGGRGHAPPLFDAPDAAMVHLLVAAGAAVEDADGEDGLSPLMAAANDGRLEAVRALIEAGADPHRISDGDDAYYFAARWGHHEVAEYLEQFYPDPGSLAEARERGRRGYDLLARLGHLPPRSADP